MGGSHWHLQGSFYNELMTNLKTNFCFIKTVPSSLKVLNTRCVDGWMGDR